MKAQSPNYDESVVDYTDVYFTKSARTAKMFGDAMVTYAVFLRRPCVAALNLAIGFIQEYYPEATIYRHYKEGSLVEPGKKLMSVEGSFVQLAELETLFLQKVGFPCITAYNAYNMAMSLPDVPFVAMDARHSTGEDMMKLAAYGASVGTELANRMGAKGFVGSSTNVCSKYFGKDSGFGTIPHALIGYAYNYLLENGYTYDEARLDATRMSLEMFNSANPEETNLVALVDYFGNEVTDALNCASWFYDEMKLQDKGKKFGVRLDTHGKRFLEGLDYETSVSVVANWLRMPNADEYEIVRQILGDDVRDVASDSYIDEVRKVLFAPGVSAAAIIQMRKSLNKAGYNNALIIGSSGFDPLKTAIMSKINIPVDMIGSGSFTPKTLGETHATADIYKYNDTYSVKVGRENLIK